MSVMSGSKGTNLTAAFDGNRPIDIVIPGPSVPSVASRRPFKGFDTINVTKSIGNSTYHSLQLKAERRSARGLSILGAYTWSHSISNADISSVGGGAYLAGIQDYMNLDDSRSDSVFDIRHRLSIAAIYDVPLFRDARQPCSVLCWEAGDSAPSLPPKPASRPLWLEWWTPPVRASFHVPISCRVRIRCLTGTNELRRGGSTRRPSPYPRRAGLARLRGTRFICRD